MTDRIADHEGSLWSCDSCGDSEVRAVEGSGLVPFGRGEHRQVRSCVPGCKEEIEEQTLLSQG